MGATGESVRQVTDFGYDPAWSPDGKEIVCATEGIRDPYTGFGDSQLWTVDVTTGEKGMIGAGFAVQPDWSPHGQRIAYWAIARDGERDILTVAADGGELVAVTEDAANDWHPFWSPDGKHLYFASDRGGSMNLWRIAIDEATGRPLGAPEPIVTPTPWASSPSLSRDYRRMAYVSVIPGSNLHKIRFDPTTEKVQGGARSPSRMARAGPLWGSPRPTASGWRSPPGPHRDRKTSLSSGRTAPADVYSPTTFTGTDERAGRPTESGLPFSRIEAAATKSGPSGPTGAGSDSSVTLRDVPWARRSGHRMDRGWLSTTIVGATSWSPTKPGASRNPRNCHRSASKVILFIPSPGHRTAKWIAGMVYLPQAPLGKVVIYSMLSGRYTELSESGGEFMVWMADSRRILFVFEGKLFVVDRESQAVRQVFAPSEGEIRQPAISQDNRTIHFSLVTVEGDVWLIDLGSGS